jgi:hypothetical protein
MTTIRARTIHSSILFGGTTVDGHRTEGQPFMVRMQGIPTAPGYHDRPGKWNFQDMGERLKKLLNPLPKPEPGFGD